MDEINKRIIEFMIKSGHSKSTFARELDVSLPLITHITTGRNKPGLDLIQKLLTTFPDLNPDWLLNGLGAMSREKAEPIDLSVPMAQLNKVKDLIASPIASLETAMGYHKLLMDELLHLQEIDIQINQGKEDLKQVIREIIMVKSAIEFKVNN